MKRLFAAILMSLWAALAVAQMPPKPGPKDTCPVCGMLVSKYPNWVATVVYKDGHAHHFDGAKDMFKFWFDPPKYVAEHNRKMISSIWVTEYYGLRKIDARKAWYVVGSDILGPMGHEFVPLANQAEADDFIKEHKGKRMLRFEEVTAAMTLDLDDGRF